MCDCQPISELFRVEGLDCRDEAAVIRKALRRLRSEDLKRQYAQLWAEWDDEDDVWDVTVGDGIEDESDVAW